MAFSESEREEIDQALGKLCDRVPEHVRHQVWIEYSVVDHTAIAEEVRVTKNWEMEKKITRRGIAQFRYVRTSAEWKLFWMRAAGNWQVYNPHPTGKTIDDLVEVVIEDPVHCFFG